MSAAEHTAGIETGQASPKVVRRDIVSASLRVGNPVTQNRDITLPANLDSERHIEVDVGRIKAYEHNPRRARNARFMEIKDSIRVSGLRNPFTITRRPGEEHFIVESGGNTRLIAIQELWHETAEPRFGKLWLLFRPWRSESHVLISHLIENEQRGEMTFWDKANGIAALKTQLEVEQGRELSLRQLETELKRVGIAVSHTTLNYYRFTTRRLRTLAESVTELTGLDVIRIQPRLNQIKRYAQARAALGEDELYSEVLQPVFRRHADMFVNTRNFEPQALCLDCETALALRLNEPVQKCRRALDALAGSVSSEAATQDGTGDISTGYCEAGDRIIPDRGDDVDPADTASPASDAKGAQSAAVNSIYNALPDARTSAVNTVYRDSQVHVPGNPQFKTNPTAVVVEEPDDGDHHQRLLSRIERFATLAGIGDCLSVAPATPMGYAVTALPPAGHGSLPPQRRAWWLLALLCDCVAHKSLMARADTKEIAVGLSINAENDQRAPLIDMPFLLWLFDPTDESAAAFRQIMALVVGTGGAVSNASTPSVRTPPCSEWG